MTSAARTELAFFWAAEVSFLFHAIQYKKMSEQKGQPFARPVTDEAVLKTVKEIMIKFIEIGKVTPANFEEHYRLIFNTVRQSAEELNK